VVGVLAGAALILYTLIERDSRPWRRLHLLPGLALFLLIAAPWFIAVSARNPSFPGFFFVHEHFERFLTTVHQRVEPWWYFLPLLALAVLPWIVPLARAGRSAWAGEPREGAAGEFRPLKFLIIYAAVTLVFFSASGSKLAPYILPMLPVLAAVTGAAGGPGDHAPRRAALIGLALLLVVVAVGLPYGALHNSYVPRAALFWCLAALAAGSAAVVMARRGPGGDARARLVPSLATSAAAILAWQCLLCAYTVVPPSRSARELVEAVRPHVGAGTLLYSVGQYRETVSPYLGRTLRLAGYEGELRFGLQEEPGEALSVEEFASRWSAGGEAVAFFDPQVWDEWRRRGLPGQVIAADSHTIAVSRL